jgi:hypothetical protein
MRIYPTIILVALVGQIHHAFGADGWEFAREWVGNYPSSRVGDYRAGLLAQPAIKATLKKILPRTESSTLAALTIESKVTETDGLIVISKCRPHNCPSDMATVIIDVKKSRLWVGLFTREAARVSTRWYGEDLDYSTLPEDIRREFLSRHGD